VLDVPGTFFNATHQVRAIVIGVSKANPLAEIDWFLQCNCDGQSEIKKFITSSFHPFGEKEGMTYFEFLKALFPGISFVVVDTVPIAASSSCYWLLGTTKWGSNNIRSFRSFI
jgi:hypothetical protein